MAATARRADVEPGVLAGPPAWAGHHTVDACRCAERNRLEDGCNRQSNRLSSGAVRPLPPDEPAVRRAPNPTTVRLELTCLLCGELAGVIENGRVVRACMPGSVRYDRRRLTCGRCGSALIPGDEDR